jgi:hypothetical protein
MDDKITDIVGNLINRKQTLFQQNYLVQLILGDIIEPEEALEVIVPFFDSLTSQYGLIPEQVDDVRNGIERWIEDETYELYRDIDDLTEAYDEDVNSLKLRSRGHVVEHMQGLLRKLEENRPH